MHMWGKTWIFRNFNLPVTDHATMSGDDKQDNIYTRVWADRAIDKCNFEFINYNCSNG